MIRKATLQDVPALAKLLSNCKETRNIILTSTYFAKNNVFLAEEDKNIVGFCAIHEVKQAIRSKNTVIDTGYWLEQFFVSPDAKPDVAPTLIQYIKDYCLSKNIMTLKVFASHKALNDLYIKMGAIRKNNTLLFNTGVNNMSLTEKLAALDEDLLEDALYEEEESRYYTYNDDEDDDYTLYYDDDYDDDYDEDIEDELEAYEETEEDEEDEIFINKQSFKPVVVADTQPTQLKEPIRLSDIERPRCQVKSYDNKEITYLQPNTTDEKVVSRLSYEECKKNVTPIGYKFEQEKDERKDINYEKILIDEAPELSRVQEVTYLYKDKETKDTNSTQKLYQQLFSKMEHWANEKTIDTLNERKHFDKQRAKILLRDFNHLEADSPDTAYELLEKLFGKVGEDIHIEPRFKCSYGYNIEIGDNFYADANCIIDDNATVKIGNHCILSPGVSILTLAYPLNARKRKDGQEIARPVTIGNNVWIGGNATIYPGVTIGNNVVVSPGSVVICDIPDDVVVAGNPAQIISMD